MPPGDSVTVNENGSVDLFVYPDGVSRDGASIHVPADMIDELIRRYEAASAALGKPWGEGDEFAEQMEKVLGPLQTNLMTYLGYIAEALRMSADNTIRTAKNFQVTEENNITTITGTGGGADTGGGGRR
ncbi:hypothetical protein LG943_11810 [Streptomonospora sp. S1-112]|uniref:Uncharacterized protein n=1 Tax=Streptomonospora mangrovi TaxID=2883123 RepID=A0A9X3SNA5_9ACTN|nr:hypothetical protein [Streptomonospora mangrovi]MDA0565001.1 hypothetical protein [Streptomonospora mangrovi]